MNPTKQGGNMLTEKKWLLSVTVILTFGFFIVMSCGEKKTDDQNAEVSTDQPSSGTSDVADVDVGLPIYPGSEQDPQNPPINTPHMKNLKLLTSDSFDEVVAWYSQKLGEFDIDNQDKGSQALWNKKTDDLFQAVTISTINADAGKVVITLVKGKVGRR
jgi:hypothetical protein